MQIVIRADSSILIGSGHVMRCMVLADSLRDAGHSVFFICRDLPGNCHELILKHSHACKLLPYSAQQKQAYSVVGANDDYAKWLGVSQQQDADETLSAISGHEVDLLITDVYGLNRDWELAVKAHVKRLMVIDDLANRPHECDVLLDYNPYNNYLNRYDSLVPRSCKKLLGLRYALINPALAAVRRGRLDKKASPISSVHSLLVFLGSMDAKNLTDVVLAQLIQSRWSRCRVDVVLGAQNPYIDDIINKYRDWPDIHFHIQPAYYFDLMMKADMAISAAGISILERLYVGLPSIIVKAADNQQQICQDLSERDLVVYVDDTSRLAETIDHLPDDIIRRLQSKNDFFSANGALLQDLLNEISHLSCPA
ncbi:UDP-2,4-diacetamido-2,4,6-trideoxy-beta-L-altropyranose hydrolase [Legionella sp. CNM-4043-24]|uniref:UDP-2,4-diacetamido-2,4, 6-trideoxy-beta-L-altropyranose hydrolase n=1 Tax=Legionella sp. CNM-4043-24 TaxID=3421646 RepID=UPI00403AE7CA